jgi:hypothetical protein
MRRFCATIQESSSSPGAIDISRSYQHQGPSFYAGSAIHLTESTAYRIAIPSHFSVVDANALAESDNAAKRRLLHRRWFARNIDLPVQNGNRK